MHATSYATPAMSKMPPVTGNSAPGSFKSPNTNPATASATINSVPVMSIAAPATFSSAHLFSSPIPLTISAEAVTFPALADFFFPVSLPGSPLHFMNLPAALMFHSFPAKSFFPALSFQAASRTPRFFAGTLHPTPGSIRSRAGETCEKLL